MDNGTTRFLSAHNTSKQYGIPENMIRRDIKTGRAPGFYSGTWFHVDVPAYLRILTERKAGGVEANAGE